METRGGTNRIAQWINKLTGAVISTGTKPSDPLVPKVLSGTTKSGRTKKSFGTHKLFAADLVISPGGTGPDGTPVPPVRRKVLAERKAVDGTGASKDAEFFHPVMESGKLDTSIKLFKQPKRRLGVRGGKLFNQPDGGWGVVGSDAVSAAVAGKWLPADALEGFASDKPGFRALGNRECCVAPVIGEGKESKKSSPVMMERVRGATTAGDHYCLLNADWSRGEKVELIGGEAADPVVAEVVRRIATAQRPGDREMAEAAAINALVAGAPLADAVSVVNNLLPHARPGQAGGAQDPSVVEACAVAGAVAGAAQRAGMSGSDASAIATTVAAAAATLRSDFETDVDLRSLPIEQGRLLIASRTYDLAAVELRKERDAFRTWDPGTLGADHIAINAAHRLLFVDTGRTPRPDPARTAEEALQDRIEEVRDRLDAKNAQVGEAARKLSASAGEADKLRRLLDEAETRLGLPPAPDDPDPNGDLEKRQRDFIRRKGMYDELHARLETAGKVRGTEAATLKDREQEAAQLRRDLEELEQLGDASAGRLTAAVTALINAHAAAPKEPQAALAAAMAASAAMAATATTAEPAGNADVARSAAKSAHLAMLAGAGADDAQVAGRLVTRFYGEVPGIEQQTADAALAGIVQAVTAGTIDSGGTANRPILAAVAMAAAAGGPNPNLVATAAMGKAVESAKPAPARGQEEPVFAAAGTAAPKAKSTPIPAVPSHYVPVAAPRIEGTPEPAPGREHARLRHVVNHGVTTGGSAKSEEATNRYIVEMMHEGGRVWTNLDMSSNYNQGFGEIMIRPKNQPNDRLAVQGKIVVAYNGLRGGEWGSFEQRDRDRLERTAAAVDEMMRLLASRDSELGLTHFGYHGGKSGHLVNLRPYVERWMTEEIRLVAQSPRSNPAFEQNMADKCVEWVEMIEGDRERKKSISREQARTIAASVLAVVYGSARVAIVA